MKPKKSPSREAPRKVSWGILEDCIGAVLRFAENESYSGTSEVLAPFGLTPGSFTVLVLIKENREATQSDVGSMVLMTKGNFAGLIARLERRGLVVRTPCTEDRRRQRLSLSAAGQALLARASEHHDAYHAAIVAHIGRAAHQRLIRTLHALRTAPRFRVAAGRGATAKTRS